MQLSKEYLTEGYKQMDKIFSNKTCIVTGAASGMGKATAIKYAKNGADIILMDINENGVQKLAKDISELGVKVMPITVDLSISKEIDRAMDMVEAEFSEINILANCAGIPLSQKFIDVKEEEWDKVMDVNLKSVFLLCQRVAKNMIKNKVKNGKIVTISSQASKIGEFGNVVYCVSKAGVNMLTQVLALELASFGVSVNAVCPGYVNTELVQKVFQERGPIEGMTPKEYEKTLTDGVPMKRMAEPEEIADLLLFLSSEEANYITGVSITSAGGKTLI